VAGIGSRLGETHDSTGRICCAVPEARCGRPPEEGSFDGFGEEDETVEVVVFVFVFFFQEHFIPSFVLLCLVLRPFFSLIS
jgi:hypothetical protein